jgi:hypothetical protein
MTGQADQPPHLSCRMSLPLIDEALHGGFEIAESGLDALQFEFRLGPAYAVGAGRADRDPRMMLNMIG